MQYSADDGDLGFTFNIHKDGSVVIFHHGKLATKFNSKNGAKYAVQLGSMDFQHQQLLMARLTGNYKHGNEKNNKKNY